MTNWFVPVATGAPVAARTNSQVTPLSRERSTVTYCHAGAPACSFTVTSMRPDALTALHDTEVIVVGVTLMSNCSKSQADHCAIPCSVCAARMYARKVVEFGRPVAT